MVLGYILENGINNWLLQKKSLLFVVIVIKTLFVYNACLGILGKCNSTLLGNSLLCIMFTFTMQWQQYLLPVSFCFLKIHFKAPTCWFFDISWKMASTLIVHWKNPLLYVLIVFQTLCESTVGWGILGNGINTLLKNLLWCIIFWEMSSKQTTQLHQSWFTTNSVWVKLGIAHFGINGPSLWCMVKNTTIRTVGSNSKILLHKK